MSDITHHADYRQALASIKQRIQTSQTRAVLAVNAELLNLYWDIGRQLDAWQRERAWGSAVVEQMAQDLQASYPGMKGFSRTSLFAMRQFYAFFSPQFEVVPQPVGQMPWGHVRTLLTKVKSVEQVLLYAQACIEHGWSRTVLEWQIEQRFHERAGKAIGNFAQTLPAPQSELVQQSLKDPYVFDFLTLAPQAVERDIENQLVAQITRFLLELGKGFAFVGPAFTDVKYFGDGVGIAVRKGDKANVDRINAAIDAIRANGKYKEIEKKYFNFDIYGPDSN